MPKTKSTKKALRQSKRKRLHNLFYKRAMKNLEKEIERLLKESKKSEAKDLLPRYYKVVDKAAKENVIKKNKANRKKSRIAKLLK